MKLSEVMAQQPKKLKLSDLMAEQQETQPIQAASPRMQRGQNQRADELARIDQFRQQSAAQNLPFVRDLEEIGAAPEMNMKLDPKLMVGSGSKLTALLGNPSFRASLAANFGFDDKEVADMAIEQLGGDIGKDAEGNVFISLPSGNYAINKPGFSGQDFAKLATGAAAFTPAGGARTLTGQALGGAATQTAVEAGQALGGGEINPEEIALAGGAPIVMNKIIQGGKEIIKRTRPTVVDDYIDDIGKIQQQDPSKAIDGQALDVVENQVNAPRKPIFELSNRRAAREGLKNKTVEGVGWKEGARGRLVADDIERDLVRSNVDDRAIVAFNSMGKGTKESSKKMVQLAKNFVRGVAGSENKTPNLVVGESMMKRFNKVAEYQKQESKRIGNAVKANSSQKIEIEQIFDDYLDDLENAGVSIDGNKLDFSLSDLRGTNTSPINAVLDRLESGKNSFEDLHKLKRFIYEQVSFANDPTSGAKISSSGEQALKKVASAINDRLRKASTDYAEANDNFAAAAEVVYPFAKVMGRRFDPAGDRVENLVGQELRKTLSNYAVAQDMTSAYMNLDAFAQGVGGKFSDDIGGLISLSNELEKIGSFRGQSFQGNIEKAIGSSIGPQGSVTVDLIKGTLNEAKDRVLYETPSADKLKVLDNIEKLLSR